MSMPTVLDELDYSILLTEIDAFTASMNIDLAQILLRSSVVPINAGSAIRKDAAGSSFSWVNPAPMCTCRECSKEAA